MSITINTIFSSLVTLLVGLFAFIIYRIEKNDKEKSAANIILEEINSAERNIEKLKESGDLLNVSPDSFSDKGWNDYRHLIVKYFDYDEYTQVSLFFERIRSLKNILRQWREIRHDSLKSKAIHMQEVLIDLVKDKGVEVYEVEKESITKVIHSETYLFEPKYHKDQIKLILSLLGVISTSSIGLKVKLIKKKQWFSVL